MKSPTDWDRAYTRGTLRRPTNLDCLKPNILGYDETEEDIFDRKMQWLGRGLGVICVVLLGVFFYKILST